MNYIDLIVIITLAFAIFDGWRHGITVQICSLVGVILGIWLGSNYGTAVGQIFTLKGQYAAIGGFVVIFLITMIVVTIVSRVIKKLFSFVGLGIIDTLLGIMLSVCKYTLILSVVFSAFNGLNENLDLVSKKSLKSSKLYKPIIGVSDKIFPSLDWAKKQISSELEKMQ